MTIRYTFTISPLFVHPLVCTLTTLSGERRPSEPPLDPWSRVTLSIGDASVSTTMPLTANLIGEMALWSARRALAVDIGEACAVCGIPEVLTSETAEVEAERCWDALVELARSDVGGRGAAWASELRNAALSAVTAQRRAEWMAGQ